MRVTHSILALTLLGAPISAAPYFVPIINAGFEDISRSLNVGEITNGAAGVGVTVGTRSNFNAPPDYTSPVEVPGWRTFTPTNPNTIVRAGAMNPPVFAQGPYITGYSGVNIATLQVTPMQQTLPFLVQPSTRYTLTFRAGIGRFDSNYAAFAALIAVPDTTAIYFRGNPVTVTLVGTQSELFDAPGNTTGVMRPITIEYTSPSTLPANIHGKYLCISIIGSDGIPRMNFDDFSLLATPVGCPGDLNTDGNIDTADLVQFLGAFGQTVTPGAPGDLNNDGAVNTQDLTQFLAAFGTQC